MSATRVVRALALLSPRDPSDDDLGSALGFLGVDIDPGTAIRAADGLGVVVAGGGWLALVATPPAMRGVLLALVAVLAGAAWYGARRLPRLAATARRTRALGAAPALVTRAVMCARVTPTAEAAAAFAARAGSDPLAASLAAHVRRARGTGESGFDGFADEWDDRFPALGRAVRLVTAATTAPAEERARTLDRALAAVLDGTCDRAADGAARLHGPVTAVYAFGVLLPLTLVAALPAARVAGLPVTGTGILIVYDCLLPIALVGASTWLVANRPVTFPPVRVPRSHPGVQTGRWRAPTVGLTAAIAGGSIAATLLSPWATPIAAVGCGLGTALAVRFRPAVAVRDRVREMEAGLPDALYHVGRRVRDGTAVEAALSAAADDVDGATGALLAEAATRGRRLGLGVRASFLGRYGALASVPSPRARSVARLFAVAANEGRPAGAGLVAMADHLDELRTVEREARRSLARATATMGNTAALFAPLVAGVTVALAERVAGSGLGADGVPTPVIGMALGWYVLVLAALLTTLATGLERGFDRATVGYRVGLALVAATTTYLVSVAAGGRIA